MKHIAIIALMAMTMANITNAATKKNVGHPHGIDVTNMNQSVKPGNDFYKFATERWNQKYPMPAEYSRFGVFNLLIDENNKRIRTLIEEMGNNVGAAGTIESKIGTLYRMVMDSTRLQQEGLRPIKKYLDMLSKIGSRKDIVYATAEMGRRGVTCFFAYGAEADAKNSKQNLVEVGQGGLTLGQREYYLDTDEATMKIRNAYREFGEKLLSKLYPEKSAEQVKKMMESVIRIETHLASSFKTRAQLREPENNYNKISLKALEQSYPDIDWKLFFDTNKFAAFNEVNVGQPAAIKAANDIIAEEPIEDLKTYLTFRGAQRYMTLLNDEMRTLHFDFFDKTLSGAEQEMPRWKTAVNLCNGLLGEAIGKVYAEKYFPEEAKQKMKTLVANLQDALKERIMAQEWMSDETKQKALGKLGTFYVKIGYPDKWRDFSALQISEKESLLDNVLNIVTFNNDYEVATTVGKPVNRDRWYMTPQTVNAYYNPPTNEICFPAGILQYPFFDPEADDAFNYGAIGVVIGHEMTHGFDDQGRKYDKDGNMSEWWSEDDSRKFNERAARCVEFFNQIEVLPGLHGNGALTAGENLADHGGLQVAYTAMKNAAKGQKAKTISGFTPEQRFFLAYAGVWAGSIRDAEIRKRVKSDPHSLAQWRVNGTLPHINMWYDAFGITQKDKLFISKNERVDIW